MSRFAKIAVRPIPRLAPLAILAASLAVAGCGDDAGAPKRAVDSRTEVIRYYPASAEVVALVDTNVQLRDLRALSRTVSPIPGWPQLRREVSRALDASGLSVRREIAPLLGNELAIGARTIRDLARGRPLLVLEARDAPQLEAILRRAVTNGGLEPAGRYRRAALYRTASTALAARDGVLLAAADAAALRRALDIRDGDDADRLDDDEVGEVLDELPPEPGIHAYVNLGKVLEERLSGEAERRLDRVPWLAALGRAGISFALRHDSATLAFVARTERRSVEDSELPIAVGEAPPRLHRVQAGLRAGLRGAARAERITRRASALLGSQLPVLERIETLIAEIARGGPAARVKVPGAAGSLALDGGLRNALRAAGSATDVVRDVPRILRVSAYASMSTEELRGRVEFTR